MNRDIARQLITVLVFIATVIVNSLANALPLNGQTTGAISDSFKVFFVPAGYVFSIWGLIYLALGTFTVYQALPAQRTNPRLRRIGYWFIAGSIANIAWIFFWHYNIFPLTLVMMLILLVSLLVVYVRLEIGVKAPSKIERWTINFPFSLYLGWITVATIANVTSLLDYLKWNGWGIAPEIWTVVMLAVAVIVAGLMLLSRRDSTYLLVLVWAFVGIALKHSAVPTVTIAAWVAAALVAAFAVANWLWKRKLVKIISA